MTVRPELTTNTPATAGDLRTVARGTIIQFVGSGTRRGASLIFVAVAIRLLGAAGFGLYRQVAQILMTTSAVAMMGFNTALLRSVAQARARGEQGAARAAMRTAVTTVVVTSTILLLPFAFFADSVASVFVDTPAQLDEMAFLLRLGAAFIPIYALASVLGTGAMGFKTVVPSVMVENILQPVSLLIFATAAIAAGYGVRGVVGGLVASAFLALLVAVWFFRKLLSEVPSRPSRISSFRSMAGFALPQAGARVLRWGSAGTLLLGILGTDREVALFAVATALQGIILIFPQAFLSIWQPLVVDLTEKSEPERLRAVYQTVNRWVASCSFGFIIALVVLPDPFVRLLGGVSLQEATLLTSVIAMGTFVQVATGHCAALVTMAGYPVINLLTTIGILSGYVAAAWLIVPSYGAIGIAYIHAAAAALGNLALMIAAKWLTGLQPFGRSFLKPVGAMCVAGVVLLTWKMSMHRSLPMDFLGLGFAGLSYSGMLWVGGMDAQDRIVYDRIRARMKTLLSR